MDDMLATFVLRGIIFAEEQGLPYASEYDTFDHAGCDNSVHIIGSIHAEPIATGRVIFTDSCAKLERIAVRRNYRSNGYGSLMVEYMIAVAKKKPTREIKIHSQSHLIDFYKKFGFTSHGSDFLEENTPHRLMTLDD